MSASDLYGPTFGTANNSNGSKKHPWAQKVENDFLEDEVKSDVLKTLFKREWQGDIELRLGYEDKAPKNKVKHVIS